MLAVCAIPTRGDRLDVSRELKKRGVRLVFAGVPDPVRAELDRAGVTATVGKNACYERVTDLITAYCVAARSR